MKRSMLFLAVSAGVLSACADDPTRPADISAPQLAVSAAVSAAVAAEAPRHVVKFGGSEPATFVADVAALGGSVEFVSEIGGFAGVSGLTEEAAASLAARSGVSDVFEDVIVSLGAEPVIGQMEAVEVNPASATNPAAAFRHSYQWNMRAIGAHTAWAAGELGSPDVTVAILDTGIDYDAYDMAAVVDVARSRSFVSNDDNLVNALFPGRHPIDDLNGHGTNVATQVSSGGVLFAGVNSRVRLMGVKVLGYNGSGSLAGILAGLMYAAEEGADVANMSLGVRFGVSKAQSRGFIGITSEAFNHANRNGMIVVVSAGNDGQNMDNEGNIFRAYCEASHVVCVSALGPTASTNSFSGPWTNADAGASYSNIGRQSITVSAPGGTTSGWVAAQCARHRLFISATGAITTLCNAPPGFFATTGYAGTSQAAPHVAGLIAKLVEKHGKNNPAQVRHALVKSVDDLGPNGRDAVYGHGRINVAKALGL